MIADGKRGDIGSTAEAYAAAYLAPRRGTPPFADALTVNPYLGADSLEPFAEACRASGGLAFVLVRTSNPGGADIQELRARRRLTRLGARRAHRRLARARRRSRRRRDPTREPSPVHAS